MPNLQANDTDSQSIQHLESGMSETTRSWAIAVSVLKGIPLILLFTIGQSSSYVFGQIDQEEYASSFQTSTELLLKYGLPLGAQLLFAMIRSRVGLIVFSIILLALDFEIAYHLTTTTSNGTITAAALLPVWVLQSLVIVKTARDFKLD